MLGGVVTLLFGENSYERTAEIAKMRKQAEDSNFEVLKIDTDKISKDEFISAVCGMSLLSDKRFVVARNLSDSSEIWQDLPNIISRISTDVNLCLVEDKIDKRSTVYKKISKVIQVSEFKNPTTKDSKSLAELARSLAKRNNLSLDNKTANFLVSWVGVNEWEIRNSIDKLSLIGDISENSIKEFIPQNIESNAFEILNLALDGDHLSIMEETNKLKITDGADGAYQFFGLISSQFFNLVALKFGKQDMKNNSEIAKEIGANAWALGKMESYSNRLNDSQLRAITNKFLEVDEVLKTENVDPWKIIEALLLDISIK